MPFLETPCTCFWSFAIRKNITNQNRLGHTQALLKIPEHCSTEVPIKKWNWNDVADEDINFTLGSQFCCCCCWLYKCCLKMLKNALRGVDVEGNVNFCKLLQMFKRCWLAVRFSSCVCFLQVSPQVSCAMFFCWYPPPSLFLVYGSSLFSFHQSCC